MYLLDTNVISAIRQKQPAPFSWLAAVPLNRCYLSVISLGEVEKGIAMALVRDPPFATILRAWLAALRTDFDPRTLPVSEPIALEWGRIAAKRTRAAADALIGATALAHGLTLVTRNTRDFDDLGIPLLNPWEG